MNYSEAALQRQIVGFLGWALKSPAWYTTIGHGGGGQMRGMILKGMGLKAGVPDLIIVHDGRAFWLELKAGTSLSAVQREIHASLDAAGSKVATCRSLDDVIAALTSWGIPLRTETVATERIRRGILNAQG